MLQLGLAYDHYKAIPIGLAIIQSILYAYNASSQLIGSIKRMFVWSLNTTKFMRFGMVNPFRLNSIEIHGFLSTKLPALSMVQDQ